MSPDNITLIAKTAHEVNRAYCISRGDLTQPPWDHAPDWQRNSALAGVAFHLGNPSATPADSHAKWMAQKLAEGWVYGPVKDPTLKQHPCIAPYELLPVEQRTKDFLFKAVIDSLRGLP